MNNKYLLVLGIGVLALGYIFNLGYAVNDYGMVENSLTLSVIAQSGSSGEGSGSESGSGSGSTSGGGTKCPKADYEEDDGTCWKANMCETESTSKKVADTEIVFPDGEIVQVKDVIIVVKICVSGNGIICYDGIVLYCTIDGIPESSGSFTEYHCTG